MKELNGKNAIVTGASSGIGPEIARALAEQGVGVVLTARTVAPMEALAAELRESGHRAIVIPADITDPLAREALVTRAEAELGPIDILVNSAGTHNGGRLQVRSLDDLETVIETNLIGSMMLTRCLLPGMLKRRQGHIVYLSSLAGKVGMPYLAAYAASKYGQVGFNQSLQAELRGTGVHSSAIIQGFVKDRGMWARLHRKVHPAFGLSSPQAVANAVIKAIRHERVEVIVNPLPVRPVLLLWAIAPDWATGVFRLLGVNGFMKGVSLQIEAEDALQIPDMALETEMAMQL